METIRIKDKDVDKDDVWLYINHFGKDKTNLWDWEKMRSILHNNILSNLGLKRGEDLKFEEALDIFCEPHILQFDPITAKAKKLMRAKSVGEIDIAQYELQIAAKRESYRINKGFRNFNSSDERICRVCQKEWKGGTNDHLGNVPGFPQQNRPICSDCMVKNPDEYHITFKKLYWSK